MNINDKIKQQLADHKIVLYMKGTPVFPQCGFSSKAVSLLRDCLQKCQPAITEKDVLYVNVLEDSEIREGIKQYGQWPTIPQLYIKGDLVGGSDIMTSLHSTGELEQMVREAAL